MLLDKIMAHVLRHESADLLQDQADDLQPRYPKENCVENDNCHNKNRPGTVMT
jgi:hypothetical protein